MEQRFTGLNVDRGGDDALFALVDGVVRFEERKEIRKQVSICPVYRKMTKDAAITDASCWLWLQRLFLYHKTAFYYIKRRKNMFADRATISIGRKRWRWTSVSKEEIICSQLGGPDGGDGGGRGGDVIFEVDGKLNTLQGLQTPQKICSERR